MSGILKDKYFILCLVVSIVLVATSIVKDSDVNGMIGTVSDVSESSNGFVFYFDTSEGTTQKCFCRERPDVRHVYLVDGKLSDDGTILFISSMSVL